MSQQPWIKWYPVDWRADPRLRMCSLAARGLWIELIGYMHEGEPYGHLTINDIAPSIEDIAALVGRPLAEVRKAMAELEHRQVYSTDALQGTPYSRRMVRDKAKADQDRRNGKGGGNPKLTGEDKGGVNPPDKAQKLEARDQKDSEATASGAVAPIDHRKRLFDEGLAKLAKLTGKGPDACRSFVGKCLKASGDDAVTVLGLIEEAERNQVVDPSAWIAARLKTTEQFHAKPGSKIIQAADDLCRKVASKVASFDGPRAELRDDSRPLIAGLLSDR